MVVFWVIATFGLVKFTDDSEARRFIALMIKVGSASETSVVFYETKRLNTTEDSHLHNMKWNLTEHAVKTELDGCSSGQCPTVGSAVTVYEISESTMLVCRLNCVI
jgi:hypothetical protein